jgi:hypothetical protein
LDLKEMKEQGREEKSAIIFYKNLLISPDRTGIEDV